MESVEELIEIDDIDLEEETEETEGDFQIGDKAFFIKFNQKRIELYEQLNKPLMAAFIQNGGAFSVAELKSLLAYGLCTENGAWINPKKGKEIANALMEKNGYLAIYEHVSTALERDCGFLFLKAAD